MPSSDDAILRDTSSPIPSPADSPPSPTLTPAATPTSTPPPPTLNASALPSPTYHPQDPTKKSHARKQAPGHVPRPRNPFILFRCDFVRQHKVPKDLERDHRNISRIAGAVWRGMGEGERRPWVEMAEREKGEHRRCYPGYRYSPGGGVGAGGVGRRRKRGDVGEVEMGEVGFGLRDSSSSMEGRDVRTRVVDKEPAPVRKTNVNRRAARARNLDHRWTIEDDLCCDSTTSGSTFLPHHRYIAYNPDDDPPQPQPPTHPSPTPSHLTYRRSSSCPPGAPRIPAPSATLQAPAPSSLLITRDDLARRPSRITMYQSTTATSTCFTSGAVNPPHPGLAHVSPSTRALYERVFRGEAVCDMRPVLSTGPYVVDPPEGGMGWGACSGGPVPVPVPWEWDAGAGFSETQHGSDIPPRVLMASAYTSATFESMQLHALPPLPRASLPTFTNPFFTATARAPAPPTSSTPSTPTSSSWSSGKSDTDTDSPFSTPSPRLRFRPAPAGTGARANSEIETGAKSYVGDFARMSLDGVGFGGFL